MRIPVLISTLLLSGSIWAQTVIHAGKLFDAAAGVHSIEHGTYMSDEVMELMREIGAACIDFLGCIPGLGWLLSISEIP